ncbi:unnamed protein product, partial [Rotaria socialis]
LLLLHPFVKINDHNFLHYEEYVSEEKFYFDLYRLNWLNIDKFYFDLYRSNLLNIVYYSRNTRQNRYSILIYIDGTS